MNKNGFDTKSRDRFLDKIKHNPLLDGADKSAISEAVLLKSLRAHKYEADCVIGYLFKSHPENENASS